MSEVYLIASLQSQFYHIYIHYAIISTKLKYCLLLIHNVQGKNNVRYIRIYNFYNSDSLHYIWICVVTKINIYVANTIIIKNGRMKMITKYKCDSKTNIKLVQLESLSSFYILHMSAQEFLKQTKFKFRTTKFSELVGYPMHQSEPHQKRKPGVRQWRSC